MEAASEQLQRTDADVVEAAIEQIENLSKDKKSKARKLLADDGAFMSTLSRCLVADQPALEVLMNLGGEVVFKCLTQELTPNHVQTIAFRARKIDTHAARQLLLSLIARLLTVGQRVDAGIFATIPETSLPKYASSQAAGLFAALESWLEDQAQPELLKRKLAAILILSLANLRGNEPEDLAVMPRLIRSLRESQIDPRTFSERVLQEWTDHIRRLPRATVVELADALLERPDGFQTRFWDEKQLGPLAATASVRRPSGSGPLALPGDTQSQPPDLSEVLPKQQESLAGKVAFPQIQSDQLQVLPPQVSLADEPATLDLSLTQPMALEWLSGLHTHIGTILKIAIDSSRLKQRTLEAEQKLETAERSLQQTLEQLRSNETAVAEAEAALARFRQQHEDDIAALADGRSHSESLDRRIKELEGLKNDADARIARFKAELDEVPRTRILYGEQRTLELKNSLRERISMEISGLPPLGPDLSQDNFSMLRVRFRNLLKVLHENGIIDALPGDGAR